MILSKDILLTVLYKHNVLKHYRSSSPILDREEDTTTGHPKSGIKLLPRVVLELKLLCFSLQHFFSTDINTLAGESEHPN